MSRRRRQVVRAVVGRRGDFRESSRVVTLWTRERGLVRALAKGAHRKDSQFLGRLDGFNIVHATLGGGNDTMPLLHGVELLHEPRALRTPTRYFAAAWLGELLGGGFATDRPDPELFDLLTGGLTLIERAPPAALANVVLGLELRMLELQGSLPDLGSCSTCGRPAESGPMYSDREVDGLLCAAHRGPSARVVPHATLAWLHGLRNTKGRSWPQLPAPPSVQGAADILGRWLPAVIDRRPRLRPYALALAPDPSHRFNSTHERRSISTPADPT